MSSPMQQQESGYAQSGRALLDRLEDERDELKDCSRIPGQPSALDPFTAQRIANTMYEAAAKIETLEKAAEPFISLLADKDGGGRFIYDGNDSNPRLAYVRGTDLRALARAVKGDGE